MPSHFNGKTILALPVVSKMMATRAYDEDLQEYESEPAHVTIWTQTQVLDGFVESHYEFVDSGLDTFGADVVENAIYQIVDEYSAATGATDPFDLIADLTAPDNALTPV